MLNQRRGSLHPGIRQLADLLAVELLPPLIVEHVVEVSDMLAGSEVDEGVSNVAGVLSKAVSTDESMGR